MTSLKRVLGRATLVAAAVAAVAGLGATPASAASSTLGFFQPCDNPAYVGLWIHGKTDLGYPGGRRFTIDLWGSDPVWDDHLAGPYVVTDTNPYQNQGFDFYFCFSAGTLNEDVGEDEIYFEIDIRANASTAYHEHTTTNQIHHSF